MEITEFGIVSWVNDEHPEKAEDPIDDRHVPNLREIREEHP